MVSGLIRIRGDKAVENDLSWPIRANGVWDGEKDLREFEAKDYLG